MSAETLSTLATLAASIVAVISTLIALRSAKAAEHSAVVAAKVLHRSAVRDLVAESNVVIAEELRIQSLVIDLRSQYKSVFVGNGQASSSRKSTVIDQLDKDLVATSALANQAKAIVGGEDHLLGSSENDLDLMQGRIQADRWKLQTVRESMLRHLEQVRTEILLTK